MHLVDITEEMLRTVLTSAGLDAADIETVVRNDEGETLVMDRCDFRAKIGSIKRTDDGFLQGDAAVARVGILTYFLPSGGTRRELVPAATLFDQVSMDSLKLKPVTDTHPQQLVTSKTASRKKVGSTGETIQRDSDFLKTSLVVTDAEAISSVEGGREELSPGYRAEVLMRPGMWNGESYDGIQVRRTYNHLALCDRARGGRDLRINIDGADHFDGFAMDEDVHLLTDKTQVRGALLRLSQLDLTDEQKSASLTSIKSRAKELGVTVNADSVEELVALFKDNSDNLFTTSKRSRFMEHITLDGISYEADKQVINHLGRVQTACDTATTELATAKTDNVTLTAERDTLKAKVDEFEKAAKDDGPLKARVDARISLLTFAREYLDEETVKTLDGMSDLDVRKAIILKRFPESKAKLDDKDATEEYINARYDAALDVLKTDKENGIDPLAHQRGQAAPRQDSAPGKGKDRTQETARADMESSILDGWKPPKKD